MFQSNARNRDAIHVKDKTVTCQPNGGQLGEDHEEDEENECTVNSIISGMQLQLIIITNAYLT